MFFCASVQAQGGPGGGNAPPTGDSAAIIPVVDEAASDDIGQTVAVVNNLSAVESGQVTITINPVDNEPEITAPAAVTYDEGAARLIELSGISNGPNEQPVSATYSQDRTVEVTWKTSRNDGADGLGDGTATGRVSMTETFTLTGDAVAIDDVVAGLATKSLQLKRGASTWVVVELSLGLLPEGRSATLTLGVNAPPTGDSPEGSDNGLLGLPVVRPVTSADGTSVELELGADCLAALAVTTLRLTVEGENVTAGASQLLRVEVIPVEVTLVLSVDQVVLRAGETTTVVVSLSEALLGDESVTVTVKSRNQNALSVAAPESAVLNSTRSTLGVTVTARDVPTPMPVTLTVLMMEATNLAVLPGKTEVAVNPAVEVIARTPGPLQLIRGASIQVVVELSSVLLEGRGATATWSVDQGDDDGLKWPLPRHIMPTTGTSVEFKLSAGRSAALGVTTLRLTVEGDGVGSQAVLLAVEVIPVEATLMLSAVEDALKPGETADVEVSLSKELMGRESVLVMVKSGDPNALSVALPETVVLNSTRSTLGVTVTARDVLTPMLVTLTALAMKTTDLAVLPGKTEVAVNPAIEVISRTPVQLIRSASTQVVVELSSALLEGRGATATWSVDQVDQGDGDGLKWPLPRHIMPTTGTSVEFKLSAGRSAALGVTTLRLTVEGDGVGSQAVLLAVEVIPVEATLILSAVEGALKPDGTVDVEVSLSEELMGKESVSVTAMVTSGNPDALLVKVPVLMVLSSTASTLKVTVTARDVPTLTSVTLTAQATKTTELRVLPGETKVTVEPGDVAVELETDSLQLTRGASTRVVVELSLGLLPEGRSATLTLGVAEGSDNGLLGLPVVRPVTSADGTSVELELGADCLAALVVTTLRLTVEGENVTAGASRLLAVKVIPVEATLVLSADQVVLQPGETTTVVVSLSEALLGDESVMVTNGDTNALSVVLPETAVLNNTRSTLGVTVTAQDVASSVSVMLTAQATTMTELSVLPGGTVVTVEPRNVTAGLATESLRLMRGASTQVTVELSSALAAGRSATLTLNVDPGDSNGLELPMPRRIRSVDGTSVALELNAGRPAVLGVTTLRLTAEGENVAVAPQLLRVEVTPLEVLLRLSADQVVLKAGETTMVVVSLSEELMGEESVSVTAMVTSGNPNALSVLLPASPVLNSARSTLGVTVTAQDVASSVSVMLAAQAMAMTELSVLPGGTAVTVEPRDVTVELAKDSLQLRRGASTKVVVELSSALLPEGRSATLTLNVDPGDSNGLELPMPRRITSVDGTSVALELSADRSAALDVTTLKLTVEGEGVEVGPSQLLRVEVMSAQVALVLSADQVVLKAGETTMVVVSLSEELMGEESVSVTAMVTSGDSNALSVALPETVMLNSTKSTLGVTVRALEVSAPVIVTLTARATEATELSVLPDVLEVIILPMRALRFRIRVFLEGSLQ